MSNSSATQADNVGALLRQSRELKGLTTAEVAAQLRLKVSLIEQIEAEQWDPEVSVTFMRGYLRAYARLMKLSEKEILQNFDLQTAYLRRQAKPMHSFSRKTRLDKVDNRFMLASYLLIVLLIGLFLIWFWQTYLLDSQPVSVIPQYQVEAAAVDATARPAPVKPAAEKTAAEKTAAVTPVAANPLLSQNTGNSPASSQVAATDGAAVPEPVAGSVPADLPADQSIDTTGVNATAAADAPAPATEPGATSSALLEPVQAEPIQAEPIQAEPEPESIKPAETVIAQPTTAQTAAGQPSLGTGELQLTFSADCWLEVFDAQGNRLAFGTQKAGKTLQLSAALPVKITLGNAAAATVQLNQTPVDLSGFKARRVARLTLDGRL